MGKDIQVEAVFAAQDLGVVGDGFVGGLPAKLRTYWPVVTGIERGLEARPRRRGREPCFPVGASANDPNG